MTDAVVAILAQLDAAAHPIHHYRQLRKSRAKPQPILRHLTRILEPALEQPRALELINADVIEAHTLDLPQRGSAPRQQLGQCLLRIHTRRILLQSQLA